MIVRNLEILTNETKYLRKHGTFNKQKCLDFPNTVMSVKSDKVQVLNILVGSKNIDMKNGLFPGKIVPPY